MNNPMHGQVYCVCHKPNKGKEDIKEKKQANPFKSKIAEINKELTRLHLLYDEADDYEVEGEDIRDTLEEIFRNNIDLVSDYLKSKINTENSQEYFVYKLNDPVKQLDTKKLAHDAYDFLFQYGEFKDDLGYLGYLLWTKYDGGHSTVVETFEGIIDSFIKYSVIKA